VTVNSIVKPNQKLTKSATAAVTIPASTRYYYESQETNFRAFTYFAKG